MAASARATTFAPHCIAVPNLSADRQDRKDVAPVSLVDIHDFAVDLALRAGSMVRNSALRRAQRSHLTADGCEAGEGSGGSDTRLKASQVDLVTEVDVAVEDFIREEIERQWPTHRIVAEESYGSNHSVKDRWEREQGPTWFIDPLDGTLNYVHLFPLHCISVGFSCSHTTSGSMIADDALVGVIYAPSMGATGTLWTGTRGHGAYLAYPLAIPSSAEQRAVGHECQLKDLRRRSEDTGARAGGEVQRLPLVAQPLPSEAPSGILFASEWGKDRRRGEHGDGNLARKLSTMTNMAANDYRPAEQRLHADPSFANDPPRYVHGVRSLGSSTLDLAFVAQGSMDVLWEGGCWEWDVCAGIAILLEAGGLLTDSNPPPPRSPLWSTMDLPRADLGARRFLAVRSAINSKDETSLAAQQRVARQVWSRSGGLNYRREGVIYAVEQPIGNDIEKRKPKDQGDGRGAESRATLKTSSSVRNWEMDPLRERKRLTREEALAQAADSEHNASEDTFGGRLLDASKDPWSHNAWDHVEPPPEYLEMIEDKLKAQKLTRLTDDEAMRFNGSPASFWDSFYSQHENRFFKDRRWLHLEFPELIQASLSDAPPTRILEVGCGAGNTVFPLLEKNRNPNLQIYACDYSAEAVSVVKSNSLYTDPPCGQSFASVWDLASCTANGMPKTPEGVQPHSLDIVVLIFVLSALHPEEWTRAVANVRHLLKPDGIVLIRDYGRHDLPQLRFGKGRMMADNLYVRGDGTRVYFFTPQEFLAMFNAAPPTRIESSGDRVEGEGETVALTPSSAAANAKTASTPSSGLYAFETLQLAIDRRMLLNRKEKKQMFRNWLQAKFRLLAEPSDQQ